MFKKMFLILSALTAITLLCENAYSIPLIGDEAPSFKAKTTDKEINFPQDYKGKWVVLLSHPGDFTPVCTTEFLAFQDELAKFSSLNTELLGLSVDNVEHHNEWIKSMKTLTFNGNENVEIDFPIIDDEKKEISKKYGMLQRDGDNSKTVRAVFVIDPDSKIRAIIYYPQNIGRYIPEIQRLVLALQTADAFDIATPANWLPGDDVVVSSANIPEGKTASELKEENITKHSPYLFTKKLEKKTICDKLFK